MQGYVSRIVCFLHQVCRGSVRVVIQTVLSAYMTSQLYQLCYSQAHAYCDFSAAIVVATPLEPSGDRHITITSLLYMRPYYNNYGWIRQLPNTRWARALSRGNNITRAIGSICLHVQTSHVTERSTSVCAFDGLCDSPLCFKFLSFTKSWLCP